MKSWKTPSRTSPQPGSQRPCLCKNGTYSKKCCDGSLQAQGIGPISRARGAFTIGFTEGFDTAK